METYPMKTTLTIMEESLQQANVITTSITTKIYALVASTKGLKYLARK
jgi:hypothetical protein